jgi:6-phosphogluconolactonase/glucosamine-6-phosphate isomerase/deaminase
VNPEIKKAIEEALPFSTDQKILNAIRNLQERNETITQRSIAREAELSEATIRNRKNMNPEIKKAIEEALPKKKSKKGSKTSDSSLVDKQDSFTALIPSLQKLFGEFGETLKYKLGVGSYLEETFFRVTPLLVGQLVYSHSPLWGTVVFVVASAIAGLIFYYLHPEGKRKPAALVAVSTPIALIPVLWGISPWFLVLPFAIHSGVNLIQTIRGKPLAIIGEGKDLTPRRFQAGIKKIKDKYIGKTDKRLLGSKRVIHAYKNLVKRIYYHPIDDEEDYFEIITNADEYIVISYSNSTGKTRLVNVDEFKTKEGRVDYSRVERILSDKKGSVEKIIYKAKNPPLSARVFLECIDEGRDVLTSIVIAEAKDPMRSHEIYNELLEELGDAKARTLATGEDADTCYDNYRELQWQGWSNVEAYRIAKPKPYEIYKRLWGEGLDKVRAYDIAEREDREISFKVYMDLRMKGERRKPAWKIATSENPLGAKDMYLELLAQGAKRTEALETAVAAAFIGIKKNIFGENIEDWLAKHKGKGDSSVRSKAVEFLLSNRDFIAKIKAPEADFGLELVRFAVENGIRLGTKSLQLFTVALKSKAPPNLRRYIKIIWLPIVSFINLKVTTDPELKKRKEARRVAKQVRNAIRDERIQAYLEGDEFQQLHTKEAKFLELVARIVDLGLPLDAKDLSEVFTYSPEMLSEHVSKNDIEPVEFPLTIFKNVREAQGIFENMSEAYKIFKQVRTALIDDRIKTYVTGGELQKFPVKDRVGALIAMIKKCGLTLDTRDPRRVFAVLPEEVRSLVSEMFRIHQKGKGLNEKDIRAIIDAPSTVKTKLDDLPPYASLREKTVNRLEQLGRKGGRLYGEIAMMLNHCEIYLIKVPSCYYGIKIDSKEAFSFGYTDMVHNGLYLPENLVRYLMGNGKENEAIALLAYLSTGLLSVQHFKERGPQEMAEYIEWQICGGPEEGKSSLDITLDILIDQHLAYQKALNGALEDGKIEPGSSEHRDEEPLSIIGKDKGDNINMIEAFLIVFECFMNSSEDTDIGMTISARLMETLELLGIFSKSGFQKFQKSMERLQELVVQGKVQKQNGAIRKEIGIINDYLLPMGYYICCLDTVDQEPRFRLKCYRIDRIQEFRKNGKTAKVAYLERLRKHDMDKPDITGTRIDASPRDDLIIIPKDESFAIIRDIVFPALTGNLKAVWGCDLSESEMAVARELVERDLETIMETVKVESPLEKIRTLAKLLEEYTPLKERFTEEMRSVDIYETDKLTQKLTKISSDIARELEGMLFSRRDIVSDSSQRDYIMKWRNLVKSINAINKEIQEDYYRRIIERIEEALALSRGVYEVERKFSEGNSRSEFMAVCAKLARTPPFGINLLQTFRILRSEQVQEVDPDKFDAVAMVFAELKAKLAPETRTNVELLNKVLDSEVKKCQAILEKAYASKKEQGNELLIDFTSFWKGNKHFIPIIKNKKCLKGHKFYKQALNGSDSFEGIKPIFEKLIKDEGLSKENVKIKVLDFDPDPTVTANVLYMKDGRKVIVINKAFVRMIAFQLMNGYQDIILEDKETNKKSDLVTSEVYSIAIHELRAHLKLGLFDERVAQYHRGEKYKDINVAATIYSWSMSLKKFDLYKIKGFVEDNPHLVPIKYRSYYIRQVKDIDDQRIIDNQGEIRDVPIPRPSEYQFAKITELKQLVYSRGLKKYMKDFTDYDEDILEYERLKLRADYIVGNEVSDQDDRKPSSEEETPATQAKEWIRSVMQVALNAYKDEDFSVLLDMTIDVEGRPLTCVTDSKPFDANSPKMFVTAGSVKCSPIICQTKSKVKAFDNHLYHLPIGNENDMKDEKHLRYLGKYLGYIGDRECVVIIPFNEEFEDPYKKVSEYILNKHKNAKVLLIRTKSNTTKAGLVMREGIGIDVGEKEVGYLHVPAMPKKGTSRTLALTWEQVYALLGRERKVVKDFEELCDSNFVKQSGEKGQLLREETIRGILKNLPDYVVSLASLFEHICKEHPEMLEIPGIKTEDEQFDELVRICCKFNEGDFEDPKAKAKDIINEASQKRIDFYRAVGQEAREFITEHEDEFRKLGRKFEMITCQGHSFEVQKRLERRGIKSKIFYRGDETGFHFWVVTEDGFIIDAYTSSAAYTSEENELLVLKCNQDIKNEYVGKEIGQLKKSIKTRIEKERKIWMGVAERVRAHQIYTDAYNKARNMVLSINPDIEEAGITFACEIIKAIQEWMNKLPKDKKIIIHFCTGDTPWIGYIKLAYYLENWDSKEVQDILRAHGIKGEDLKLKPDMSRVEAYPLDAIFPQKRTAYSSFANILNNMFDRLKIPKDQRHLFYGDVDEYGNQMSDKDFDRLMKNIDENGLLINNPNEIQTPFINAMRKHADRRSKKIEVKEGAHIFLAGFGPSYEGRAHIAFIKLITSFFKKAFIDSAPRDVTAAHAKENGGLGNFYVDGISKYGVISFGFHELLLRQGNLDIKDDVKVIAVATGNAKNSSVQKLVEGDYDETYPVTGLQDSRGVVVLDQTSAASLRLHTHPWEFYHIDEWNAQLIKKFFIQLSLDTAKPIRELTVQDFLEQPTMGSDEIQKIKEYNLSTLGSWDDMKEQVIQEVKDAITTPEELDIKLGLPAKSRLVFINPHPDDDYFAMRDGIEALARKGYEVCAYYVTPGYNAVDDRYTANILNHIKGWTKEQLIQYAKLNEEKLTGKLSDLVEGQNLHQNPTDYDVWSHMKDEEKLLRAQPLFLSFNQRMNGMLTDKVKCDALINLLVGTLKNKEAWGGKDIKLMCDIKTYIRTTEAKSAMMSLGLKYKNIHVPLDPSWYITEERRPTASPEDIERLKDILQYENRDGNLSMVIYNGEGLPDYAAHSTVEASVDTALRELIEKAERASIFGPMIRGVARRLGKWLPLGLAALLALVPLNLRIFKACQYTGIWERTATHQAQLSLLSPEEKVAEFNRKSRQHYPSQSPPILADSGYETPYHFSEQVVMNKIKTRREVATLLGPEDTRKEWQPILESPQAGILNYKILDFTDRAKRGELKKRLREKAEELNKVRDAVNSTNDVERNGPASLPDIAAMKKEIEALKEAGISLGDVLSRDEFKNQLRNAKQKRHKVAAEKVLRMIDTASASDRLSRPGPGEHGDTQNDTRDWNKLTRARAHISFERLFASKLYTKRQVEVLKKVLYLYRIDPSRSIRSVFRDREIKAYVKKQIQEILIDRFIASFYSRKGKNAGKLHVFGLDRAEIKKEIDELGKIYKFFAEVLGYDYPCRILQKRINNNQLNVLHVPKGQKTIFDAHCSPTYGINICSSCRDKGRAIVHELMALAGSTDDAFNQRVDKAYRAWRDFGKVSGIKRIKKIIRQKEQDAMDKIIKAEFPDITDISIPASLKGELDIEYKKENQFGSVKELEVILGETVEDIAIAYPVGMGSFLRASKEAIIISEREDLRDKHNKLKEYVPMLVATCNSNDTKLRQKAVDYLIFIIARCPAVPLDYVFIQFQLQRIEIKDDLQDAFKKAYLAEWSSSPAEAAKLFESPTKKKAARLFDSPTKKEEMEMNLKEIAILSNRAAFYEKNKQPGLADVAYTKAYYLFKWHIRELVSSARDSLEKAELLTLNVYDKTKVEIEQAIEKMFVTISHQPERFKALGIELDSVERAYANYCLAKEELKRVQGKIKKLIEGKESSIIDEPELAGRDDIGQTLSIYRQRIEESKLIENDLEEEIRMLHGKFSEEILLVSVEDRDFAKLNDGEERSPSPLGERIVPEAQSAQQSKKTLGWLSKYIPVIVATMFIILSGIAAYFFPEISAQALKLQAAFGSPGDGAQLASLGGFIGMLLFGGVAVGVGGRVMGIPVRNRVIGLKEMIESVRGLVKEFYSQVCIAKEYLVKVAVFRLPEVLGLGVLRKVEKRVVQTRREREQMRLSWTAFWQQLPR